MPEDTPFSTHRPLAGLQPAIDERSRNVQLASLESPLLQSTLRLTISSIFIPLPVGFEKALLSQLLEVGYGPPPVNPLPSGTPSVVRQRAQSWQQASTSMRITARRVQIGLHSTHLVLGLPASPTSSSASAPGQKMQVVTLPLELSGAPGQPTDGQQGGGSPAKSKSPQKGKGGEGKGGAEEMSQLRTIAGKYVQLGSNRLWSHSQVPHVPQAPSFLHGSRVACIPLGSGLQCSMDLC
jgi:hypothetical protein